MPMNEAMILLTYLYNYFLQLPYLPTVYIPICLPVAYIYRTGMSVFHVGTLSLLAAPCSFCSVSQAAMHINLRINLPPGSLCLVLALRG